MGKRNRERRRQKLRQRHEGQQRRAQPRGPGWRRPQLDGELIVMAIDAAAEAHARGDASRLAELLELLVAGPEGRGGAAAVDVALAGALERAVGSAWRRGWQPADLVRVVRRKRTAAHVPVVARAITAEARRHAAVTIDPCWACLLYTSPSPRDVEESRMPSSA